MNGREIQSDLFSRIGGWDAVAEARAILERAIAEYRPSRVHALFSGGHDSLCAAHLASTCSRFDGCVHVNTGVGIEATREFVWSTCIAMGWPLREMSPPPFTGVVRCGTCRGRDPNCGRCHGTGRRDLRKPGIDYEHLPCYEALVLHYGFPGAYGHSMVYNRLKERCIRRLVRESGGGLCSHCGEPGPGHGSPISRKRPRDHAHDPQRVLLVTGVRRQESRRRMGYIVPCQREGSRVWVAPLVDWSREDKEAYIEAHGLPRNEVVAHMCMSGECCCGAFSSPGELEEIAHYYPETAAYLRDLMRRAREVGSPHPVWGEKTKGGPRPKVDPADIPGQACIGLCWSCEAHQEDPG